MRLSNRTAIITGAGRGIGRASALAFAREGARVAVADIAAEARYPYDPAGGAVLKVKGSQG